jgi:hypothetical protein
MKLKLGQLIDARGALRAIGAERLPVKLAYRIQRNMRKIDIELREVDEANLKLIRELGEKQPDGNWHVKPENLDAFRDAMKALRDEDIEIDIRAVSIDELPVDVAPLTLMDLDFMFEAGKEDA